MRKENVLKNNTNEYISNNIDIHVGLHNYIIHNSMADDNPHFTNFILVAI